MNWLVFALTLITQIPKVVLGVEALAMGAKQGAKKKDLAMASLGLSASVAADVLPEHRPAIEAATTLASNAIDNFVALANAAKHPEFIKSSNAPAPQSATSCVPTSVEPELNVVVGPGLPEDVPTLA